MTIHEAAASLASELESAWDKKLVRTGNAYEHFQVRVRGDRIVLRAMTATANGWHRLRNLDCRHWHGFETLLVFCVQGESLDDELNWRASRQLEREANELDLAAERLRADAASMVGKETA